VRAAVPLFLVAPMPAGLVPFDEYTLDNGDASTLPQREPTVLALRVVLDD
jgi:hypothetical protein